MKYLLLRNEKSVSEVATRAYRGLTDKARKKAEAALLKANPKLKSFKSVGKGRIIRVPSVEVGKGKNRRNLVDPVEEKVLEIANILELIEENMIKEFANFEERQKCEAEHLKAANRELKKHPNGAAMAKTLKKHATEAKKLHEKNRKLGLAGLDKLRKTAASYDR